MAVLAPTPAATSKILAAIRQELEESPELLAAAKSGVLVLILKLDRRGHPQQIQLKIDLPRRPIND